MEENVDFPIRMTPRQMFEAGIFGGAYFRPIHSSITNQDYENQHLEFDFLSSLPKDVVANRTFDSSKNKHKILAGSSLEDWEMKSWIKAQDPYGWVQWYCRYYMGRRTEDDVRQIDRWHKFCGPKKGRFRTNLINQIAKSGGDINDMTISPKIRQGLLQWGYELTQEDYDQKLGIVSIPKQIVTKSKSSKFDYLIKDEDLDNMTVFGIFDEDYPNLESMDDFNDMIPEIPGASITNDQQIFSLNSGTCRMLNGMSVKVNFKRKIVTPENQKVDIEILGIEDRGKYKFVYINGVLLP